MPHTPASAGQTELGRTVGHSDGESTLQPTGLLSLPDELIARIYALTLALDIRILPTENPFSKWRTAFVNRRIYEAARPVFLSHVAVHDAQDPLSNVLSFIARQAEPLHGTRSLHLEVDAPLMALSTALAPRLFPNLTSLTFAVSPNNASDSSFILPRQAIEIIPHFQQLLRLEFDGYDSLADQEFDSSRISSLQSLHLRRSTTNAIGVQMLHSLNSSSLRELEIYSHDILPSMLCLRLPWDSLRALKLYFWDEWVCYRALRLGLERARMLGSRLPLRILDVGAPWKEVESSQVTAEQPYVVAFVEFLAAVFKRANITHLKIHAITSWPPHSALLWCDTLRRLELQWTCRDAPDEPDPAPPRNALPLPSIHRILTCFPRLTHFHLDIQFLHEWSDGRWLYNCKTHRPQLDARAGG